MSLKFIKQIAFYLSLLGWLLAYFIYLASYAGMMVSSFWIWILHASVILVWLPIVIDLKNITTSADNYFTAKTNKIYSLSHFDYCLQELPIGLLL